MFFVIWIVLILLALSTVGFIIRRLVFRGFGRIAERAGQKRTRQAVPKTAELSEAELERQLRGLKLWSKVPGICVGTAIVYLFGGAIIAITTGNTEVTLTHFVVTAIVLALLFALFLIAAGKNFDLKNIMGTAVTLPVLKEVFEVSTYKPNSCLDDNFVRSSGLFTFFDKATGSDYTEGRYRGIRFYFSDLHLQCKDSDSNGKKRYRTVFKGQWLVCEFDKNLAATLRLKERNSKAIFGTHEYETGMSGIATENIAFNKKYHIMADDEHAAFYLLTPHFMERLMSLDEAADAQTFFCFENNKVHIALYNGRDSFELGKVKPSDIENLRQKFRGELKYLTNIVDDLLLNDKLFKEGSHGPDQHVVR